MNLLYTVLFSGIAGILGTGLGGLIGLFLGKGTSRTVSIILTFASGVMISISLFDLMPEANDISGPFITVLGVLLGILIIFGFNYWIDKATQTAHRKIKTHATLEALHHQDKLLLKKTVTNTKKLFTAGMIMLVAIALHNIPEGLAIGSSNAVSSNLSITLALLLTLHNIPEGMAIAVPLSASGMNKWKTIFFILLAGSTTILGGTIGAIFGNLGGLATSLSLSFAAGAMLYVTFGEIIPQAVLMEKGRAPALFSIFGILVGFLITTLL